MKKILFFLIIICSVQTYAQTYPAGLNVNDLAPGFTATDQKGEKINLKKQLKNGNVVLIFYRGQWCPFVDIGSAGEGGHFGSRHIRRRGRPA